MEGSKPEINIQFIEIAWEEAFVLWNLEKLWLIWILKPHIYLWFLNTQFVIWIQLPV